MIRAPTAGWLRSFIARERFSGKRMTSSGFRRMNLPRRKNWIHSGRQRKVQSLLWKRRSSNSVYWLNCFIFLVLLVTSLQTPDDVSAQILLFGDKDWCFLWDAQTSSQLGQSVFPGCRKGTNTVSQWRMFWSRDDGEIGWSDGTSIVSEVISKISAASEHSAAEWVRHLGMVVGTGCIQCLVCVDQKFWNF